MSTARHHAPPLLTVSTTRPAPTAPSAKMTATAPARALFIPAGVLALPGATLATKAVLADVLNLYRVSGHVFARDSYFADRLGISVRSVGVSLKWLEDAGLLLRPIDNRARTKRELVPTPAAVVLADSATTTGQVADSARTIPRLVADSATTPSRICNDSLQDLQGLVADSADISNTLKIESESKILSTPTTGAAHAAAGGAGDELADAKKNSASLIDQAQGAAPAPGGRAGSGPQRPTAPQVAEYMSSYLAEHRVAAPNMQPEANTFCDHYTSNGWKISGKTPMKDWQAAVRNWLRRRPEFFPSTSNSISHAGPKKSYSNSGTSAAHNLNTPKPDSAEGWGYPGS